MSITAPLDLETVLAMLNAACDPQVNDATTRDLCIVWLYGYTLETPCTSASAAKALGEIAANYRRAAATPAPAVSNPDLARFESCLKHARETAERTGFQGDYQAAAAYANRCAELAPYGEKERFWALADELNAALLRR